MGKFHEELEATLSMIMGCQGVALNCITGENNAPVCNDNIEFEENAISEIDLTGPKCNIDARTVHQITLNDVHKDSDACTCIKPSLRFRDRRHDISELRGKYSNDGVKTMSIDNTKRLLETIWYENELVFSFEKFSAKSQKACNDLEANGRKTHNGDTDRILATLGLSGIWMDYLSCSWRRRKKQVWAMMGEGPFPALKACTELGQTGINHAVCGRTGQGRRQQQQPTKCRGK